MSYTDTSTHVMSTSEPPPSHLPMNERGRAVARRVGLDLAYLVAVLFTSVLGFAVWVTGLSVTVSLLVLIVGVFAWLGTVYVVRWTTLLDRALAGWSRGERIEAVYRRPHDRGLIERLRTVTADPQTWKDLGWLVLNSIAGFAAAILALSVTALVLGYILMPAWWWTVSNPHDQYVSVNLGVYTVNDASHAWLTTALGLALAPLALLLNHGIVTAHSALAARILGPSRSQELRRRVDQLTATRAAAVEASRDQLERIERDLHDGAQARLVSLAMGLGMAREEAEADPEAARRAVLWARDEALAALAELRALSRGIRPALLAERGLTVAVEALADRMPMPVTVSLAGDVDGVDEPPQTAAYFVIAEGLTNTAKHTDADRVRVAVSRTEDALSVSVEDDGPGGADPAGRGLEGLRKRVRALDGSLEVSSPPGGPTVVSAVLPCG
jgi:signal transduction histidine kinase